MVSELGRDDPLTQLDCGYRNASDRMVIVRCCGPEQFYLERVVFPFELLSFQCPAQAEVEIWTHGLGGPELLESIRSEELQLDPGAGMAAVGMQKQESPWLLVG